MNKLKFLTISIIMLLLFSAASPSTGISASPRGGHGVSPILVATAGYSVLGGQAVDCQSGPSTFSGDVGVSSGTSIIGFPGNNCNITPPGATQNNNASAIAAQAETNAVFNGPLNLQSCDQSFPDGQNLTLISPLGPGVYCSVGSFLLTGNLTLTGSGVWIFRTVSTLITSPGSSVTGGDPCNVWWRIGSAATLDTTTSFIGNIFTANVADTTAMNAGATLNGRILVQDAATVVLNNVNIFGPVCATTGGEEDNSVSGLPNTGGAPIQNGDFPWSLAILGGISAIALGLGLRAYRRNQLSK